MTTPAVKVKVNPLPAGQPASFGGGVGNFGISARLTTDNLKTHDAASLVITVSGRGNVALLEEPKVNFPPDFEVYDTKTTENTDKSNGGTSGSKSFEYPSSREATETSRSIRWNIPTMMSMPVNM